MAHQFPFDNIEKRKKTGDFFQPHRGTDYGMVNEPLYALADGVVTGLRPDNGEIWVEYDNIIKTVPDSTTVITRILGVKKSGYFHCSRIDVGQGQRVKKGQLVGISGDKVESYPNQYHLHARFENVDYDAINPEWAIACWLLWDKYDALSAKYKAAIKSSFKAEYIKLKAKYTKLTKDYATIKKSFTVGQAKLKKATATISKLKKTQVTLQKRVRSLQAEKSRLKKQVKELEFKNFNTEEKMKGTQGAVDDLESQIKVLQLDSKKNLDARAILKGQKEELNKKLDSTKTELENCKQGSKAKTTGELFNAFFKSIFKR